VKGYNSPVRHYVTPLRVLTVIGLGLLLLLWCTSLVGLMANTRLGEYYLHRDSFGWEPRSRR